MHAAKRRSVRAAHDDLRRPKTDGERWDMRTPRSRGARPDTGHPRTIARRVPEALAVKPALRLTELELEKLVHELRLVALFVRVAVVGDLRVDAGLVDDHPHGEVRAEEAAQLRDRRLELARGHLDRLATDDLRLRALDEEERAHACPLGLRDLRRLRLVLLALARRHDADFFLRVGLDHPRPRVLDLLALDVGARERVLHARARGQAGLQRIEGPRQLLGVDLLLHLLRGGLCVRFFLRLFFLLVPLGGVLEGLGHRRLVRVAAGEQERRNRAWRRGCSPRTNGVRPREPGNRARSRATDDRRRWLAQSIGKAPGTDPTMRPAPLRSSALSPSSDGDLVRRAARGDRCAFAEL